MTLDSHVKAKREKRLRNSRPKPVALTDRQLRRINRKRLAWYERDYDAHVLVLLFIGEICIFAYFWFLR